MSWITTSDPLALVAIQAGQVGTPATEAAATGSSQLDTQQRSIVIGEPVPIAFCRRRNGYGGILVSPGASECRFSNDSSNAVTASYLLVVSEGELPGIQIRDVFQGPCRVGTHTQTYNRRAGTWQPGNVITDHEGYVTPEASYYCGTIGSYPRMTTVSFQVTIPDGFDNWKKQVHIYLRGGMQVARLTDGIIGPSDNFCDLARWMMINGGMWPDALIDTAKLTGTARFLENNDLTCNCWITKSSNYLDYLARWAPLFLLCESNVAGKRGLRPILPTTAGHLISTDPVSPVYTFTEDNIIADSVEIAYTSLAERRPFVAQMIWRQQLEDDFGIVRTAEVRLKGTAVDGPYESHDLSEFCTRESHAVKVGAHILARRVYTTHTLRFTARPQANNTLVTQGDIIRVRLARKASTAGTSYHNYLYQVQRISKTLTGELSYECIHFPVNRQGQSLIALAVANATGRGIMLSSNKTGISCDLNSSTDTTIPDEDYTLPDPDGIDVPNDIGIGVPEIPSEDPLNPDDGLDNGGALPFPGAPDGLTPGGPPAVAPNPCPDNAEAYVVWSYGQGDTQHTFEPNLGRGATAIGTMQMGTDYPNGGYDVTATWYCPNPNPPDPAPGGSASATATTYSGPVRPGDAAGPGKQLFYWIYLTRRYSGSQANVVALRPGSLQVLPDAYGPGERGGRYTYINADGVAVSIGEDVLKAEIKGSFSRDINGNIIPLINYTEYQGSDGEVLPEL